MYWKSCVIQLDVRDGLGLGMGMTYVEKVIFNLMYWYGMGEGRVRDNIY